VPLLRSRGFDALQLEGGILGYLQATHAARGNGGLWRGDCFVFDARGAVRSDGVTPVPRR
jgi:predicted sulfurtransferase